MGVVDDEDDCDDDGGGAKEKKKKKAGLKIEESGGLTDCIGGTVQTHLTTDSGVHDSLEEREQRPHADFETRYFSCLPPRPKTPCAGQQVSGCSATTHL